MNKTKALQLSNDRSTNKTASLSITDRIELTNSILDLISFMVTNEIVVFFKNYTALNDLYNLSRLDEDVRTLAEKVYDGINKDLFSDPNLILTEKYLLEYITKKTISTMIDVVQNHNDAIRGVNKNAEE
jgi:hypothetical protein